MDKVPMTAGGHARLTEELKNLKAGRPAISQAISQARDLGDLSENAEYHAAREELAKLEARLAYLGDKLARADVIDISNLSGTTIKFGATIELLDHNIEQKFTYQIVGEVESDIEKGLLSVSSPLARALITKTIGDVVEVTTPRGTKTYEVLSVQFV